MRQLLSLILFILAVCSAYLFWSVIYPYIVSLIPLGQYYQLLKFGAIVFVAVFGGVEVPVALFFGGVALSLMNNDK